MMTAMTMWKTTVMNWKVRVRMMRMRKDKIPISLVALIVTDKVTEELDSVKPKKS
jgi:hypothetical protein